MATEEKYIEIFLNPIRKCKDYKPKFGSIQNATGVSLDAFIKLYGADPFYSWIGLDSILMYAAHKAAGGMTSIYRQVGMGCETLFREIIIDNTNYKDAAFSRWSHSKGLQKNGKERILSLDARLDINAIQNQELKQRLDQWLKKYCKDLSIDQVPSKGVVFEVRQGYKSKDSKRQNADIENALAAYTSGYLPVFAFFSAQIDANVVSRYRNNRCGIMIGSASDNTNISLFAFVKNILGYDLAAFFERNSETFKKEIDSILKHLLDAS